MIIVIEDSNRDLGIDHILGSVPGMLLSPKRLITYVYPLLLGMNFAFVQS